MYVHTPSLSHTHSSLRETHTRPPLLHVHMHVHMQRDTLLLTLVSNTCVYAHMRERHSRSLWLHIFLCVYTYAERHAFARPCLTYICTCACRATLSRSPLLHTYVYVHTWRDALSLVFATRIYVCTSAERKHTCARAYFTYILYTRRDTLSLALAAYSFCVYTHTDTRFRARLLHNHLYVHMQRKYTLLVALAPHTWVYAYEWHSLTSSHVHV